MSSIVLNPNNPGQAQIHMQNKKNLKNTKLAFLSEQSCSIEWCRKNSIGTGEPSCQLIVPAFLGDRFHGLWEQNMEEVFPYKECI